MSNDMIDDIPLDGKSSWKINLVLVLLMLFSIGAMIVAFVLIDTLPSEVDRNVNKVGSNVDETRTEILMEIIGIKNDLRKLSDVEAEVRSLKLEVSSLKEEIVVLKEGQINGTNARDLPN